MDELRVADSINDIFKLLKRCNKYIDETEPWKLGKDEEKKDRLSTVLYNLLESIRIAAILLEPYLPQTSKKMLDAIGTHHRNYETVKMFGFLETPIRVAQKPEILFARLDQKEVFEKIEAGNKEKEAKKVEEKELISIDDFAKVELIVGKVLSCEKHPNADKLLISKIDLGNGDVRQIVSGIADSYTPGQMIGKKVVVVANLKSAKIKGVESQGMILAGKEGKVIEVVDVNGLKEGTRIS